MKIIVYLILICPFLAFAQEKSEYSIFELNYFTPNPSRVSGFESALAAHNKKFHASGPYGVRVYTIMSGQNSGKYVWSMGPTKWSTYDDRPEGKELHDLDWSSTVQPNLTSETNTQFFRFDPKLSRFPKDFNVSKLYFTHYDLKPRSGDKIRGLLEKINKVYADKLPDVIYGVYFNELPSTKEGRDVSIADFFDKYSWMSEDYLLDEKYEEVFGQGSWEAFWKEWDENILSVESEIWEYREDLSGMPALIKAAERQ